MTYKIIRSKRKTLGLEVRAEGLLVRAPFRMSESEIERFVLEHADWIQKNLQKMEKRREETAALKPLTEEDLRELAERAKAVIPDRVAYYAGKLGVSYGRITIRNQRTKWGSCSAKGNLNFNCLLMLAPPEVVDSVVAHELCHRKEMNHSKRFYAELEQIFPNYRACDSWLKQSGGLIMARAKAGRISKNSLIKNQLF